MGQGQAEDKKEKKGENKVILGVYMDCEACKQKVRKALKGFPGIESIELDMEGQKVTVKGNVDALKMYDAVKKKCGKRTILLYPQFSKEEMMKAKEDSIINSVNKIVDSITDLMNPKPPDTIVELKVRMHCGGCVKKMKKVLKSLDGVVEVDGDLASDKVVVKGRNLNAEEVCECVRETGKHCEVLSVKKEDKKQEKKGEKKDEQSEGKKGEKEEKTGGKQGKKGEKGGEKKEEKAEEKQGKKEESQEKKKEGKKAEKKEEEKKEEKSGEEAQAEKKGKGKEEEEKAQEEEKGEGKSKGKAEKQKKVEKSEELNDGGDGVEAAEVKKYVYPPYQSVSEYVYPPQIFSDENPNACSVM